MTWNATFNVVFWIRWRSWTQLLFLYYVKSLYRVIFYRSFYFLSNNVWCFKRIWCWNRLHTLYCHTASLAWSKTSTAERIYTHWCTFRSRLLLILLWKYKTGCVFLMVVVSLLHHVEFGPNDHREKAPHFIIGVFPWMAMVHYHGPFPWSITGPLPGEGVSDVNGYWRTTFTIPNCCHHHFPFFFKFSRKHHLLPLLLSISVACFVNSIHCQEYLCFQGTLYYWRQFSLKNFIKNWFLRLGDLFRICYINWNWNRTYLRSVCFINITWYVISFNKTGIIHIILPGFMGLTVDWPADRHERYRLSCDYDVIIM